MLSQLATRITTTLPLPPSWIRRADVHIDTLQGLTPIRHSIHLATLELVTFLFSLPLLRFSQALSGRLSLRTYGSNGRDSSDHA